jgi:cell division protein FtsQ
MDGGGRFLRSLSEALRLDSIAPQRPLIAAMPAFAGMPISAFARRSPAQSAIPPRPSRHSKLVEFAKRRGTPLLVFSLIGVSIGYGMLRGGAYADFIEQYGTPADIIARNIGFPISAVAITGQNGLTEAEILEASGINPKNSLAFLDVGQIRDRLRAVPLIKEASVRKLYPDQVQIEIVERQPYALWQQDGQISIVAADGTVIDTMRDGRFADLPFVVGPGANTHLPDYLALLAQAGDLKSKIRAGVFVGERRWSLATTSGVEVMLPETKPEAALTALAALERDARILEKDVISLDMRLPDRLVARLSEEAAAQRADSLAVKRTRPKAGQT